MRITNGCKALMAATAIFFGQSAFSAVIDFEELDQTAELQGVSNPYLSKGFVLTYAPADGEPYPVGFFSVGPTWQYNTGTVAFTANSCSASTTLTSGDNNPLTLISIDLAELNGPGGTKVVFEGKTGLGHRVSQEFQLDGITGFQRFYFPDSFRNLRSVTWLQGDCVNDPPHMFDNIRVELKWKTHP